MLFRSDSVGGGLVSAAMGSSSETHSYENDRKQILQLITSLGKELKELKDYVYGSQQIHPSLPTNTDFIQHINADGTIQHINMPSAYTKGNMEVAPIQEYVEQQAVPVQDDEQSLSIRDMERSNIEKALRKSHGNRKKAAQELGISDRTLYRKIKSFGIDA